MPAPDGIAEPQARQRIWDRHASPISILLLGGVLALALAGFAGGQPSPTTAADFGAATLSVRTPAVIRNGEFFETEIRVTAAVPLEDVGIAVSPGLWRDMTINTMIPAAREESFAGGRFRFAYGELTAGGALTVKIDGQINPPLFAGNEGDIALYDGDRLIGRTRLRIKVLP